MKNKKTVIVIVLVLVVIAAAIGCTAAFKYQSKSNSSTTVNRSITQTDTTVYEKVEETTSAPIKKAKYFSDVSSGDYVNNQTGSLTVEYGGYLYQTNPKIIKDESSDEDLEDFNNISRDCLKNENSEGGSEEDIIVDNVCSFSILIYNDKLYYLDIDKKAIFECDLKTEKQKPKKINKGLIVNETGTTPDTLSMQLVQNLHLINGKLVYLAKSDVMNDKSKCFSYDPKTGETKTILSSSNYADYEVVTNGIVDSDNNLFDETGRKIGKYTAPKSEVTFENDEIIIVTDYDENGKDRYSGALTVYNKENGKKEALAKDITGGYLPDRSTYNAELDCLFSVMEDETEISIDISPYIFVAD